MDFETWLKEYGPQAGYIDEVDFLACWQAAQAAERARAKELIDEITKCIGFFESTAICAADLHIAQDARDALAKYQDADY